MTTGEIITKPTTPTNLKNTIAYGVVTGQHKTRPVQSERSKIISPALQQAVESSVAELEEATFGRGKWFDIKDDVRDQNPADIAALRSYLEEDFAKNKVP